MVGINELERIFRNSSLPETHLYDIMECAMHFEWLFVVSFRYTFTYFPFSLMCKKKLEGGVHIRYSVFVKNPG